MFFFLYNWPDVDLYTRSKLAVSKSTASSVLCVTGNIETHYECYISGDGPYKD